MANANARFGTERERKGLKLLLADGWLAGRTPGSKGAMDLWAMKAGERNRLVQVKGTAAGAFADFGPEARRRLIEVARQGDADAWLLWWPRDCQPSWIHEDDWP